MAHVALYNGTGDQQAQEVQADIRRSMGMLPEVHQAMGRSGKFLKSVVMMDQAAGDNLDQRTRHLIAVAVSAANGCSYCLLAHRAVALKLGCTEQEVSGAIEMAAMMSAMNTFNKAIGLTNDITPETLGLSD